MERNLAHVERERKRPGEFRRNAQAKAARPPHQRDQSRDPNEAQAGALLEQRQRVTRAQSSRGGHISSRTRSATNMNPTALPFTPTSLRPPHNTSREGTPNFQPTDNTTASCNVPRLGVEAILSLRGPRVKPPPAPEPTDAYKAQSLLPPGLATKTQRLLIVLDLNGTLISRNRRTNTYIERPGLKPFLEYIFAHHVPMIYTSARPENAAKVVNNLLNSKQKKKLAAIWARDKLGLTREQYNEKVQVYKRLEYIWADKGIQAKHPDKMEVWSQANTVLIDDSILKGLAQPHNLLLVPEFEKVKAEQETEMVLRELVLKLEELKKQADISRLLRRWQAELIPAPRAPSTDIGEETTLHMWLTEGPAKADQEGKETISQDTKTLSKSSIATNAAQPQLNPDELSVDEDEDDEVQTELSKLLGGLLKGQNNNTQFPQSQQHTSEQPNQTRQSRAPTLSPPGERDRSASPIKADVWKDILGQK